MAFYFSYDRTVHFREWLVANDAPELDESLKPIAEEIRKAIPTYTSTTIRRYLKEARLSKYFEKISQIKKCLSDPFDPIPEDVVSQVVERFGMVSDVYPSLFPDRSFLSFSFLLYKLLETLKTPLSESCLNSLPKQTRSQGKHEMQMDRWKQICNKLNWDFIA